MNITEAALQKISELTSSAFRINVTGSERIGTHVDLILDSVRTPLDVTICFEPLVIADIHTTNHLTNKALDFDVGASEFIINTLR